MRPRLSTSMHQIATQGWPHLRRLGRPKERVLAARRGCVLAMLGVVLPCLLLGAAPAVQAEPALVQLPADMARIKQRGQLVVALVGTDFPPFFYQRDGELVGIEVDLAKSIAQALQVKVRFNREAKTFNEVIDSVAQRRADLGVSALSRTLARAQRVHFSQPYITLNNALVLNRVAFARLSPNQRLEDKVRSYSGSLGVTAGSSYAEFAKRDFPLAQINEYDNWPAVVAAVQRGEVIAGYGGEFEIKKQIKNEPRAALTLRTVTLKDIEDTWGIAVGVTDPTLLAFVNQVLDQRRDKLDIHKLMNTLQAK
jgi:polar amino acid transport system substrate-binding protein